jgi:hypothetical protein
VSDLPLRCVVDTNVAATANNANPAAGAQCVAASARALHSVMTSGHVFLDHGGRIVGEYRRRLNAKGQPGAGDLFLKWLLTNEWSDKRVTRVPLTPRSHDDEDFEELPPPPEGVRYDRSDKKFLAVAAAHPEHPVILQSFDSKWWGWRAALAKIGVHVHFLCQPEIEAKHRQKMKG